MRSSVSKLICNACSSTFELQRSPGLAYRRLNRSDNVRFGTLETHPIRPNVHEFHKKIMPPTQDFVELTDERAASRPAMRPKTRHFARPCWLNPPADSPPQ